MGKNTRKTVGRNQVTEVSVSRAPHAAMATALELAGGDKRRLRAQLEQDGRVSVLVVNHPGQRSPG